MPDSRPDEGFAWQVGVWNKMADVYRRGIDKRFVPVIEQLLTRADLRPGQAVMDLGTGTGAVAYAASVQVGPSGRITAVDISADMLAIAQTGANGRGLSNIDFAEGRGEAMPVPDRSQDVVLASLSLMYVIDRSLLAQETARVLRPGGRLVAAVWAGPDQADIVKFQQIAGSFAPKPPVDGVGPGALADPDPFLKQLSKVGLQVHHETETTRFHFSDFGSAWNALAAVTTAALDPVIQGQAQSAVREHMWNSGDGPREFCNATHFIVAKQPK